MAGRDDAPNEIMYGLTYLKWVAKNPKKPGRVEKQE